MPPLRQVGLTLLELIVVMAIVAAVMAMVGLPFLGHRQASLKILARHTDALIRLARTVAITHGVTEQLQIDPRTRTIRLHGSLSARRLHMGPLRVSHSVRVTVSANVPYGPHDMRRFFFYPDGSASPGRIVFHRHHTKRAISVGIFSHAP
ncbi:MAG: prepilin-type N-terminal cleavage/methylation domain-containing protein [Acidiferrobacter sp.]